MIAFILSQNETSHGHLMDEEDSVSAIATGSMNEPDEGTNLAIFSAEEILLTDSQRKVLRTSSQPQQLWQLHTPSDQLIYSLMFWTGSGGCDIVESENPQGAITLMRKALMLLILRPCVHFTHKLTALREEEASSCD
jgi:hypothetical protein